MVIDLSFVMESLSCCKPSVGENDTFFRNNNI